MNNEGPRPRAIEERIEELRTVYHKELRRPMPYEDCRKIMGEPGGRHEDIIPDLDTYTYLIASCSIGTGKLVARPSDYLRDTRKWLSLTFFEQYPRYADLEKLITRENTPKLYEELRVYEHARQLVLELIDAVLSSRGRTS